MVIIPRLAMLSAAAFLLSVSSRTCPAALIVHLPLDANSNALPAGRSSFVRGVIGDAVVLSSTGEGFVVETGSSKIRMSDAVSIGCWFKANRPPEAEYVIVDATGCRLAVLKESGNASFSIASVKGSLAGIAAASRATSFSGICDDQWHHLAGLYDGKAMSLYVDGVLEATIDAWGKFAELKPKLIIGRASRPSAKSDDTRPYSIDDIRVYDSALTYEVIAEWANVKARRPENLPGRKLDLQRDFLDRGVFPIQAHRGGGLSLPENTLETYRETWAMGMIPEADIRTNRDGVIICMHDSNLERLLPGAPMPWRTMPFEEMTLERVKSFDVGVFRGRPGQKVPMLEEVFQEMKGRPERILELDYKQIELTRLAELIAKYGLQGQVIFVSRFPQLIRQWQRVSPKSPTMLWMGGTDHALNLMFDQLRRDEFSGISILQIILFKDSSAEGFRPSMSYLEQRRMELAERGIALQLIPWDISDTGIFDRLLAAGYRFFATDNPHAALAAYKRTITKR